jgi:hypothetical protein
MTLGIHIRVLFDAGLIAFLSCNNRCDQHGWQWDMWYVLQSCRLVCIVSMGLPMSGQGYVHQWMNQTAVLCGIACTLSTRGGAYGALAFATVAVSSQAAMVGSTPIKTKHAYTPTPHQPIPRPIRHASVPSILLDAPATAQKRRRKRTSFGARLKAL